jgi:hypothetical protein
MRLQSAGRLFRIADIFSGADPSHWGFFSLKQGSAKALREIMPGAWRGAGSGAAGLKKHPPGFQVKVRPVTRWRLFYFPESMTENE